MGIPARMNRAAQAVRGMLAAAALASALGAGGCAGWKTEPDRPPAGVAGEPLGRIEGVERQPLVAQVERLIETMKYIGAPLAEREVEKLHEAMAGAEDEDAASGIQEVLDPHCLVEVHINPESRVKIARGPANAELVEQGWRAFLVKVHNEPGVTARLRVESRHAQPAQAPRANLISPADLSDRWMDVAMLDERPLEPNLSGLKLEYRVIQVYSRDAGMREGQLAFNVGQGSQDIGFRNDVSILFRAVAAVEVVFGIEDVDGRPTTASLTIQDSLGRYYPYFAKRLEPDFFFHEQIYRHDGESVRLPAGTYKVTHGRGPEYVSRTEEVSIPDGRRHKLRIKLKRWINPNDRGWYSGDHHIHASGCAHYKSPTIGVEPEAMMRHILGEALNVGCVLTWGPGWYHQKQNFTGKVSPLSDPDYLMRYDVEVSGFPSDHCGHLVLLRLSEDDYPGTDEKEMWPSWTLPILQWAKGQGGVVGVAHSGWGLDVYPEAALPNYKIPPMDGIGAQEYLVDVAHDAVDFISTVDTPHVWELNIWYHTLNCGFEAKISGETDFPCIYGDRVGLGRSYVKLADRNLEFDAWVQGIKAGRSYVSDGFTHLMDFTVNGVAPGGAEGSKLDLAEAGTVKVRADVAAWLDESPQMLAPGERWNASGPKSRIESAKKERVRIQDIPYNKTPYWHPERARIGGSRNVPVEVVVNGLPVARREIVADGTIQPVEFEIGIERSSWVALRILASSHTNPVTVTIGGRPVRASKRSAQWCLDGIDQVWKKKSPRIRKEELTAAESAFAKAREIYRKILEESHDDGPIVPASAVGE